MNDEIMQQDSLPGIPGVPIPDPSEPENPAITDQYKQTLENHTADMTSLVAAIQGLTDKIGGILEENASLKQQLSEQYTSTAKPTYDNEIEAFLDRPDGRFKQYMDSHTPRTN